MLSGPDTVVLLVVALLVFGPKKLPEMGKSLGKTIHDLRDAMEGRDERPVASYHPPSPPPAAATVERPSEPPMPPLPPGEPKAPV